MALDAFLVANLAWLGLGIGGADGQAVAGQVDLRHHVDVESGGVGDNLADLILGEETAIALEGFAMTGVRQRALGAAPGADLGQLRIFLDLDAPAIIVGQMHVEDIEFLCRHRIQQVLGVLDIEEVPGIIQHVAAPGKPRLVFNLAAGHDPVDFRLPGLGKDCDRQQLPQGLATVEKAGGCGGDDGHAGRTDRQAVAFFAQSCLLFVVQQHPDRILQWERGHDRRAQFQASGRPEHRRQGFGLGFGRIVVIDDLSLGSQFQTSLQPLGLCRLGHEGGGLGHRFGNGQDGGQKRDQARKQAMVQLDHCQVPYEVGKKTTEPSWTVSKAACSALE